MKKGGIVAEREAELCRYDWYAGWNDEFSSAWNGLVYEYERQIEIHRLRMGEVHDDDLGAIEKKEKEEKEEEEANKLGEEFREFKEKKERKRKRNLAAHHLPLAQHHSHFIHHHSQILMTAYSFDREPSWYQPNCEFCNRQGCYGDCECDDCGNLAKHCKCDERKQDDIN